MHINDLGYGSCLITPDKKETVRDIAISVILASYELAKPYGYGMMRPHSNELTRKMAIEMLKGKDVSKDYPMNLNSPNKVNMDYVFGRCCKTQVEIKNQGVYVRISERDRNPVEILRRAKEMLQRR